MARTTAVACPEHRGCVAVFKVVPKGEGTPIRLPFAYAEWVLAQDGIVTEVTHHDAAPYEPPPTKVDTDETKARLQELEAVVAHIESFVTRRKRLRKKYDRG